MVWNGVNSCTKPSGRMGNLPSTWGYPVRVGSNPTCSTMKELEDAPRDDPRIQGRRIRVSDILYSFYREDDTDPLDQLYYWEIEQEKVENAVEYYRENRDYYREADDKVYDVSMLDKAVEVWEDNKNRYDYDPEFPSE